MEQPCYKCGQVVEQGIPFCPHCSAPQIRVVVAEAALGPLTVADGGTTSQSEAALPASQTVPVLALPMEWSLALRPCAVAALIAAVAMVLKLMVPLIAGLGAGFLAVAFYRQRNPLIAIRPGTGARLGALCGLFCSGMTAILEAFRVLVFRETDEIRRSMLDAIQQQATRYSDPQYQAGLDFMRSPAGLIFMMVCLLFFAFLLFLVLGTLGGALGGAILGRRGRD